MDNKKLPSTYRIRKVNYRDNLRLCEKDGFFDETFNSDESIVMNEEKSFDRNECPLEVCIDGVVPHLFLKYCSKHLSINLPRKTGRECA